MSHAGGWNSTAVETWPIPGMTATSEPGPLAIRPHQLAQKSCTVAWPAMDGAAGRGDGSPGWRTTNGEAGTPNETYVTWSWRPEESTNPTPTGPTKMHASGEVDQIVNWPSRGAAATLQRIAPMATPPGRHGGGIDGDASAEPGGTTASAGLEVADEPADGGCVDDPQATTSTARPTQPIRRSLVTMGTLAHGADPVGDPDRPLAAPERGEVVERRGDVDLRPGVPELAVAALRLVHGSRSLRRGREGPSPGPGSVAETGA